MMENYEGGVISMNEKTVNDISNMLMDLEDAFYSIKKIERYQSLNQLKEYQSIMSAVEVLHHEHDVLCKMIEVLE